MLGTSSSAWLSANEADSEGEGVSSFVLEGACAFDGTFGPSVEDARTDAITVGHIGLTIAACGKGQASIFRKLLEPFGFKNRFQFFTVHTTNSRGKSTGWLSLETCSANSVHRMTGVFFSF